MKLFDLWNLLVNSFCKMNFTSAKTNTDIESFSKELIFPICSSKILRNVRRGRQFVKLKRKCTFVFKPRRCVPLSSCGANYRRSWQIRTSKNYFTRQSGQHQHCCDCGEILVCSDYSTGFNECLLPCTHILPSPEEIFLKLNMVKFN